MRSRAAILLIGIALAAARTSVGAEPKGALLESVDWPHVSATIRALHAGVPAIVKAARANGPLPADEVARSLFTPLLTEFRSPGNLTHPSVVARALEHTLAAAGKPLAKHQTLALNVLVRSFEEREERRTKSFDESTWELTKLIRAARLRDAFVRDARALLEKEQVAALCPGEVRGRLWLCPFSSAPLFLRRVRLIAFEGRNDLTERTLEILVPSLGLSPADRHRARIEIARFLSAVPDSVLLAKVDDLDRRGLVSAARAGAWAKRTAALLERLADRLELDEEGMARVRKFGVVLIPLEKERAE